MPKDLKMVEEAACIYRIILKSKNKVGLCICKTYNLYIYLQTLRSELIASSLEKNV